MILENLGLTEKGINYLTAISYCFTSGNIYGLIGDTSVNVLDRVLCGLIKESTGKRIVDHQENISFFLNDMQFLEDFNILETIEDINSKKLDKTKLNDLLLRLDLLGVCKFKLNKCPKEVIKKLGILCTLITNNKIILIEDVFKDLTASDIDRVKDLFFHLKSAGYLIILTGRNKEEFNYFADKILKIEKGSLYEIF